MFWDRTVYSIRRFDAELVAGFTRTLHELVLRQKRQLQLKDARKKKKKKDATGAESAAAAPAALPAAHEKKARRPAEEQAERGAARTARPRSDLP